MMKKLAFAFAICLTLAACDNLKSRKASASAAADTSLPPGIPPGSPRPIVADSINPAILKFEVNSHDFGTINAGDTVKYQYKFTNTGKTPLIIINSEASCGCTVAEYPQDPIAPGKSGEIKIVYHSLGQSGKQDKTVMIRANTIPAQTGVHLTGVVIGKKDLHKRRAH